MRQPRSTRGRGSGSVANRNDAVVEILKLAYEFERSVARAAPFSRLSEAVASALRGSGRVEEPVRLAVVDLNRRAGVTLPIDSRDSIFDRLLERIAGPSLWEERGCAGCEDAGWCPFF